MEHLETTRSFSVEEKLTSDKFDESFVKFMNGNGWKNIIDLARASVIQYFDF